MNAVSASSQAQDKKLTLKMMGIIGAGGLVIGVVAVIFMTYVWKTSVAYGDKDYAEAPPQVAAQQPKKAPYCDPAYPTRWIGCL